MKLCKCSRCDKEFKVSKRNSKYCSAVCRASDYAIKNKNKITAYKASYYNTNKVEINNLNMRNYYANKPSLKSKKCKHCDIKFKPTRVDMEFCGAACGSSFWRKSNKEYIKTYFYKKYHSDLNYRLKSCLRSRLNKALKDNIKSNTTMLLLGCTIEELKAHLESQFEPWMNWDNYGKYDPNKDTWQIDHIKPLAIFDLSDIDQQQEACNYKNLQPILAKNNLIKGDRYDCL